MNVPCLPSDPKNPGPGSYHDKTKQIGVNARKWSLQARNLYMNDERTAIKRAIPGPGTYEDITQLDKVGNYSTSNFL